MPLDVRLAEGVKIKIKERIIAPIGQSWDSFFQETHQ
jgi:virulence-associated protein VagC